MNEPIGNNASDMNGNVAIPDWMLKRRARQAAAMSAHSPDNSVGAAVDVADQPAAASQVTDARPPRPTPKNVPTPSRAVAQAKVANIGILETESLNRDKRTPAKTQNAPEKWTDAKWFVDFRKHYLTKEALRGYAVSLFTHLMIGLSLSVVVFHSEIRQLGVNTLMGGIGDGDDLTAGSLDGTSMFEVDPPGGGDAAEKVESLETLLSANAVSDALGSSTLSMAGEVGGGLGAGSGAGGGTGEGDGAGVGDGINLGGYKMPAGGKAVKKGSFTAWTVPEDPEPGEDYKIIIQVTYAKRNQKIPVGDITGSIIGTDKYRLMISPHTSEIIADANQVVIYIPGARARVRDTIRVYSAMLKENQQMEIVF